jgi:DNA-binding CsgD family transcriptional regulator
MNAVATAVMMNSSSGAATVTEVVSAATELAKVGRLTSLGIEGISRLPAVGTLDWCQQAASGVSHLYPKGAIAVVLVRTAEGSSSMSPRQNRRLAGIIAGGVSIGGELAAVRQYQAAHASRLAEEVRARVEDLVDRLVPLDAEGTREFASLAVTAFEPLFSNADVIVSTAPLDVGQRDRWIVTILARDPSDNTTNDRRTIEASLFAVTESLSRKAAVALGSDMDAWLSAREQAVLERLVLGHNVKEIAEEFGRSPHTIHDHVKSLHRKLHATSRGELIATALGLINHRPRTM